MMVFDDMKARDIIGINTATGIIDIADNKSGKIIQRQLQVNPNGVLGSREIRPVPIDQEGEPERIPVAQRWATTDQASSI